MELLKQGAEAKLFLTEYMGRKAVVKVREPKTYRAQELDNKILKERLHTECSLLSRAKKAGVRTPLIWKIEPARFSITTEFIQGRTIKQELLREPKNANALCELAGENIARLHSADLIHGDLTTGNIIVKSGKTNASGGGPETKLVFLDFGLGQVSGRPEDKAVDLLAFKKTFLATHFNLAEKWKTVEESYVHNYAKGNEVLRQMQKVEARARYFEP